MNRMNAHLMVLNLVLGVCAALLAVPAVAAGPCDHGMSCCPDGAGDCCESGNVVEVQCRDYYCTAFDENGHCTDTEAHPRCLVKTDKVIEASCWIQEPPL